MPSLPGFRKNWISGSGFYKDAIPNGIVAKAASGFALILVKTGAIQVKIAPSPPKINGLGQQWLGFIG